MFFARPLPCRYDWPVVTRSQLSSAFLLLALAGLLYMAGLLLAPYAQPIAWALVLAVVFHPAYRTLLGVMPNYPGLAAATLTLLIVALVVVPGLLLSGVLAAEAARGYERMAQLVASGRLPDLGALAAYPAIAAPLDWIGNRTGASDIQPAALVLEGLRWISEFVGSRAASIARNIVAFFVGMAIMVFTLFFALRDGKRMVERFGQTIPMEPSDRERIITRLQETLVAVVQGLTVTALVQGLLVGLALLVLDLPFALLLGSSAGLLAFLPVGGAAFVWIPTVIILAVLGSWLRAAILAAWCVLVVSSVDNLLRPLLIGAGAKLATPVLFFGILGGLQAFGFIGLFVGPAVLAALASLLTIYRERYLSSTS